ncbi:glutamate 5-kinase [Terrihabitans sp. B22-R8]|uniref:glutamate 5-kinase n=1 Tax=Terrihabitans sp. B22-R8 TaxID=3425128 RepID=UPI00403CC25E
MAPKLIQFRRVVVKIGSALLVDQAEGALKQNWLNSLADDLAGLTRRGADVLVVSSGSIALGRAILGLPKRVLRLEESQAAAAVGQIALARAWSEVLGRHGLRAGQILVTLGDTEERARYLNARATIGRLLDFKAVPVINENDTVATSEIRYGDNDRLAARVATMASADLLVLLSDIDGLYTAPPAQDPSAEHIAVVPRITPSIEAMAGGAASALSRGGMRTKIEAGKLATDAGTHMVIASGTIDHPLRAIEQGARCTWFLSAANPSASRKRWIGGTLEPKGALYLDEGAVKALRGGKSLLPAGVTRVEGSFQHGDAVFIRDADGHEIGRGLVAYDAADALRIAGKNSAAIAEVVGTPFRSVMVHRDDLVLRALGSSGVE